MLRLQLPRKASSDVERRRSGEVHVHGGAEAGAEAPAVDPRREGASSGRPDAPASARVDGSDALLDAVPERVLRRVGERATCVVVLDGVECVVKRDRERAGWRGLFGARASLGAREHAALAALARDGFPVPRALACVERRDARGLASAVAMEHVPHDETLRERLGCAEPAERARWGARLAELVATLHARGWYHRDLYLQHLVLRRGAAEEQALVLLDVGRARRERAPRERWFVKDVAALLHSTPRAVTARERLRFVARYLDLRDVSERRARRRFLARVIAKERRMAAHAPRAGEDRPWEDR
ncbi:MAG: hypothetical protein IPJ77_21215 [Planctomycetes bacterium]|nr:hypothetical protein [Planctomycetota bacterium]